MRQPDRNTDLSVSATYLPIGTQNLPFKR